MLEKQLEQLGFVKNEIAVYLALFDLGKCRAGEIIKHTKLHRNLVYQSLNKLIEKELVSKLVSKGIAVFEANSSESILEMVDEERSIAEDVVQNLKQRQEQSPRDIKVYEGLEGMQRARERSLQLPKDETVYVLGASQFSSTPDLESFWRKYHRKRAAKHINLKILYDRNTEGEILNWRNNLDNTQAKYLPFNAESPTWFEMFGDILNIGIPGKEPIVFSMRNKNATEGLKKYFEYFWNQDVVVETGLEALEKFIYSMLSELNPGEEYFVLGASVGDASDPGQRLYDRFHKDRVKKEVVTNMLVYKESYDLIKKRFEKSGDPDGNISHLKTFISAPPIPMQINMFKGKTRFIIYGKEPVIIYLDRSEIYDAFRAYFEVMWRQETQILRGPEIIKNIWLESIMSGELKFIGARGYFVDKYPELFEEIKEAARKKKDLKWKNIVDLGAKQHPLNKLPWMEARYTLKGSKNPNVVWLWGNKVAVANWTEVEPVVFISENKHLVQSYNDYFEELWNLK